MLNFILRNLKFIELLKLGPIWALILVLIFFLPPALATENNFYRELNAIGLPPQTNVEPIDSGQKIDLSYASRSYSTRLSPEEALLYFDKKLAEHGWVAQYHIVGSKHYCKGKYEATVSYLSGGRFDLYMLSKDLRDCRTPDNFRVSSTSWNFVLFFSSFSWILYGILIGYAFWQTKFSEYQQLFEQLRFGPLQAFLGGLVMLAFAIFLVLL